ncbi:hypothetical protein Paride_0336 [Pseudomonas phage Paride]|nr:hypothetical protein Paride_0336 [Pseudomonas phage Paride]
MQFNNCVTNIFFYRYIVNVSMLLLSKSSLLASSNDVRHNISVYTK